MSSLVFTAELTLQAHELAGRAKGEYAELKGDAKNAMADVKERFK